ncbi:MAG: UMP kinase, partial [Nanoarchaeota archaeon]|nr:UMP kinase [Nanoarchaeota archaeon]
NWKEFRKIVGDKWIPGMNTPFDPIASILAEQHNMTVIIADGKNLTNLENILSGRKYRGTTISP